MTPEIESHLTAGGRLRKRDIMVGNFLGGLAWGLGSVLGATIVVALIIWALRGVSFVPYLDQITNQIDKSREPGIQLQGNQR